MSASQRARHMAIVPQARNLPAAFTVYQSVLLGRTPYLGWLGQTSSQDQRVAHRALEQTPPWSWPSGGSASYPAASSSVSCWRAPWRRTPPSCCWTSQPPTWICNTNRACSTWCASWPASKKLAVLMVLHDLNLASLYADRVALLVDGRLKTSGTPQEVLTEENLSSVYNVPVHVVPHPDYGSPLVLPDGRFGAGS